jgi:negative regulator of genetic competence, sporulation and motility
MELIRISNRKLKIMLTPTDMCHFELNAETFGEDSGKMHRSFRLLLDEIRKQTDFDADDRHISVQYFPSREGGCEMFISRISSADDKPAEIISDTTEKDLHPWSKQNGFQRDCAYRFEDLETLLQLCKRLHSVGYIGESSAYRDHYGVYYLFITIRSSSPLSIPEEWDFITEYGTVEDPVRLKPYVIEYGTLFCNKNAVSVLSSLA